MKIVALTVAILLSIITIGLAQQAYIAGNMCAVFSSLEDMVKLLEVWSRNPEAGSFVMTEMIANGKLRKISEGQHVKVVNTASNGICQVMIDGKLGYVFGPASLKGYR